MSRAYEKASDRHVIWSDIHLDYEDWREQLEEDYPELTDEERYQQMLEINSEYLSDERANLNVQMAEPILVIADIGRWNGRFSGYKVIESGNISDCLQAEADMNEWYVDRLGDLRCDSIHHDGTNHLLYRAFKENTSQSQRERLLMRIYNGLATRMDITAVTKRLGDEISKVYGFDIPSSTGARLQEAR